MASGCWVENSCSSRRPPSHSLSRVVCTRSCTRARDGLPHEEAVRVTIRSMGLPTRDTNSAHAWSSRGPAQSPTSSWSVNEEYCLCRGTSDIPSISHSYRANVVPSRFSTLRHWMGEKKYWRKKSVTGVSTVLLVILGLVTKVSVVDPSVPRRNGPIEVEHAFGCRIAFGSPRFPIWKSACQYPLRHKFDVTSWLQRK